MINTTTSNFNQTFFGALLWAFFVYFPVNSAEKYIQIELAADHIHLLHQLGFDLKCSGHQEGAQFQLVVEQSELALLQEAEIPFQTLLDDVKAYRKKFNLEYAQKQSAVDCPSLLDQYEVPEGYSNGSWAGFYTYNEMLAIFDELALNYADLIEPLTPIGNFKTFENREILHTKLGRGNSGKQILFTSLHHAREPASLSQIVFSIRYLLENYGADDRVTSFLDEFEIVIVPCVNPDGYIYNESTSPDGFGYWRKNRRDNGDGNFGVDLNRNYGVHWGPGDGNAGSAETSSSTYVGPYAFSEPETQAIRYLCEQNNFLIAFNYHTYGNLLLYPHNHQEATYTPDSTLYRSASDLLTSKNLFESGTAPDVLYAVNGDADDWMYDSQPAKEKILSFTPELGHKNFGFWPPQEEIIPMCKAALDMNLKALELLAVQVETIPEWIVITEQQPIVAGNTLNTLEGGELALFNWSLSTAETANLLQDTTIILQLQNQVRTHEFSWPLRSGSELINGSILSLQREAINGNVIISNETFEQRYASKYQKMTFDLTEFTFSEGWQLAADGSYWAVETFPPQDYYANRRKDTISSPVISLKESMWARLDFEAWWQTSFKDDYIKLMASNADSGNWVELCTPHSAEVFVTNGNAEGSVFQDGFGSWVPTYSELSDLLGQSLRFHFVFTSDSIFRERGFRFKNMRLQTVEYLDPVLKDDSFTLYSNAEILMDLLANDEDENQARDGSLPVSVNTSNLAGTLSVISNGVFNYIPTDDFVGSTSFAYSIETKWDEEFEATVHIEVLPGQEIIAANDDASTAEDTQILIDFLNNDVLVDGETDYSITRQPANGTLTIINDEALYIPAENYFGSDSFEYELNHSLWGRAAATVQIIVEAVNDAPVFTETFIELLACEQTPTEDFSLTDIVYDPDPQDVAILEVTTEPVHGIVQIFEGNLNFIPNETQEYVTDFFTVQVKDIGGLSDETSFTVALLPELDDKPIAHNDSFLFEGEIFSSILLDVIANDVVTEVAPNLEIEILNPPQHGTLSFDGLSIWYNVSSTEDMGGDEFSYRLVQYGEPIHQQCSEVDVVTSAAAIVQINWDEGGVGIEEIDKDFGPYPNPFQDFLFIEGQSDDLEFEVLDIQGGLMKVRSEQVGSLSRLDTRALPVGIYWVKRRSLKSLKIQITKVFKH